MLRKRSRTNSEPGQFPTDLDTPLLELGNKSYFRLRDAFEGFFGLGGTGSGKSSGLVRALALSMLKHGFGGIVLCAKPGEADTWMKYAAQAGRLDSILHVHAGSPWLCNLLDYYFHVHGVDGSANIVDLTFRMAEASRLSRGEAAASSDKFWEDATRQLLLHSVPVVFAAHGNFSFDLLNQFLSSAPQTVDQAHDEAWLASSFFFQTFERARFNPRHAIDAHTLQTCASYWLHDFARLDPKTRSNIVITLTSLLSRFAHGRLHRLFCTETTFVPELTFEGVVILLDMPVKTWHEDGVIAQCILKFIWQRAVEARAERTNSDRMRPLFIAADECQFFLSSYDPEFQSTARSSRAASIFLTQSLPTIYAKIGGSRPEHQADMLIANFGTRVFCRNSCQVTNRWASESIGQGVVQRASESWGSSSGGSSGRTTGSQIGQSSSDNTTFGSSQSSQSTYSSSSSTNRTTSDGWNQSTQRGANWSTNQGGSWSEQKDYRLDPSVFATGLRSGGHEHRGRVDAIWVQAGRSFPMTGDIFTPVTFLQEGAT